MPKGLLAAEGIRAVTERPHKVTEDTHTVIVSRIAEGLMKENFHEKTSKFVTFHQRKRWQW
jgi:hypothetical protein